MKPLPCLLTTSTLLVSTQGYQQNIPPPIRTALHKSIPNSNNACTAMRATMKCNDSSNTISLLPQTMSYSSSLEVKALWSAEQDRRLQRREKKSGRYGGRAVSGGITFKDANDEFGKRLGFDMQMAPSGKYDMTDVEQGEDTTRRVRERKNNIKKIATKVRQNSPLKKQVASNLYQSILLEGDALKVQFDTEGNVQQSTRKGRTMDGHSEENTEAIHAVPAWFPFIPTKLQIESLQTAELRYACMERNLDQRGNKNQLQDRLSGWTKEQHTRRVLERNGILQNDSDQIDDLIGQVDDGSLDGIEPLINRRKSLLRSKKPGPELEKGTLGFDLGMTNTKFNANDKPEYLSSVAELSSAARNRIKESKSISSSLRLRERSHDIMDDTTQPTEEYLSGLNKTFYKTQSSYTNNFKVKQLYLQAKHADQSGDLERAKHLLNKLLQDTPNDSRVSRRLSRLHIEEGRFDEAKNILLSGLKINPKDGHLLHGLGNLELSSGNVDLARKKFKEAIRATPKFPNPYHALGTLEHSLGKVRVATTVLRMGLKQCPTNHRLHHALGDLYRDAKMLDLAEKCYLTGLDCLDAESRYIGKELSWSKSFFYTSMSYVSYDRHEKMECRKWLMKSIGKADNKMHSQGWLGLAHLEESEGNIYQARKIYQKALQIYECQRGINIGSENTAIKRPRLGDKWREVYKSYARLEELENNYIEVDKVYSRACHAFRDDWNLLESWAQFHRKYGHDTRARSLFQLACERGGCRSTEPYRVYAEFEMSKKNYLRAREILFLGAQVLSKHSNNEMEGYRKFDLPLLFHSWAICEWHLGNLDRVEILFDHGLRLTDSGSTGSKIRSVILHSVARFLYHSRRDYTLAQHCVCLALSERLRPGGTSQIWYLWAKIARAMGNLELEENCMNQARTLQGEYEPFAYMALQDDTPTNNRYFAANGMLRRTPWRHRAVGAKVMNIQFPDE